MLQFKHMKGRIKSKRYNLYASYLESNVKFKSGFEYTTKLFISLINTGKF